MKFALCVTSRPSAEAPDRAYTCTETYRVRWEDMPRTEPVSRSSASRWRSPSWASYDHIDEAWVETYLRPSDFAFGAYDGEEWWAC